MGGNTGLSAAVRAWAIAPQWSRPVMGGNTCTCS